MPKILKKSKENLDAAQKLIDTGFYTSSVHCSYYSIFQIIKHILNHKFALDYNTQDELEAYKSHKNIYQALYDKESNPSFRRDFRLKFTFIKEQRRRADYENSDLFTPEESITVKEASEILRNKLKSKFISI